VISIQTVTGSRFYTQYKDLLCFNKNLIIAGVCSLVIAAIITEYYDVNHNGRSNIILVTFVSFLTEYAVETPIFVALFYHDIKRRGKKDQRLIRNDIKRLFTAYSISDAVYFIAQIFLEIYLLQDSSLEAYQAAVYSSIMAWAIYFVIMNLVIKTKKFS
jgi:hypothetical protein